jgi:hypothetical protein
MTYQQNNYWKTSTKYIGNYRKIEIKENTLEKTVRKREAIYNNEIIKRQKQNMYAPDISSSYTVNPV